VKSASNSLIEYSERSKAKLSVQCRNLAFLLCRLVQKSVAVNIKDGFGALLPSKIKAANLSGEPAIICRGIGGLDSLESVGWCLNTRGISRGGEMVSAKRFKICHNIISKASKEHRSNPTFLQLRRDVLDFKS